MNTQERIAIKYGVPMPETCKELNWQQGTIFSWIENEEGYVLVDYKEWEKLGSPRYIPAPQMHEIVSLLPPKIEGFLEPMYLDLVSAPYHNKSCFFLQYTGVKSKKDYFTSLRIDDFHFAQPYAELYLKLKNEVIISK